MLFFLSLCRFSFSGKNKDVDYNLCALGLGQGAAVKASALVFFIFSQPRRASLPTALGAKAARAPAPQKLNHFPQDSCALCFAGPTDSRREASLVYGVSPQPLSLLRFPVVLGHLGTIGSQIALEQRPGLSSDLLSTFSTGLTRLHDT